MYGEHHALTHEFPEWRDRIHRLKQESPEFARLMDEYNELTRRIEGLESRDEPVADEHMEELKHRRVQLKDRLYSELEGSA